MPKKIKSRKVAENTIDKKESDRSKDAPAGTKRPARAAQTRERAPAKNELEEPSEESLLTDQDVYLFNEGTHYRLYEKMGAQLKKGGATHFAVWAPNADAVSVVGDFNDWNSASHRLEPRGSSGIWVGQFKDIRRGSLYKYLVSSRVTGRKVQKADPFALHSESPPMTASVVWHLDYDWNDRDWMSSRAEKNALTAPISIYEMHIGSWIRDPQDPGRSLTYRDITPKLVQYLQETGFTHVEFLPVMEHPFGGSWGYQTTGYFTPSSRWGSPQDFMYLVDHLHQNGIGVILDWVPSHFPTDEHGLGYFDGTHLFEHADPRQGFHPDWNSLIFNYGRNEVRSFLNSSALFWLDKYHIDGIRVDAVASMLYLDYSRREGEWIPNRHGGRENLEAIQFLRDLNTAIFDRFPDVQTFAEESTSWPMVSRPTYLGGLGFGMKWDMGWMHDTLEYFSHDPVHRTFHHNNLTFRMLYAFHENFVLPLSHDEVVHGKGSLLNKMPGDRWQKFANLRALYGLMFGQPAKKLLFMGGEFGQWSEWNHDRSLDWHLLEEPEHQDMKLWIADLNRLYRKEPALHKKDFDWSGFQWVDCNDSQHSVISFLRKSGAQDEVFLVVGNFTPVPRHNYRIGVPRPGVWKEVLNSDSRSYGGSGMGNMGYVETVPLSMHGWHQTLNLTLPPLSVLFLKAPTGNSS